MQFELLQSIFFNIFYRFNIFYIDIPADLRNAMEAATTDEACEQVGTEWLIQQSKELKAACVPILHYYTLGKPKVINDVCKSIF